jgi:site-specific DNA-methyltransferase (adenine-specific)
MELNKIYNTDCIGFMEEMPSNSVDFTLTDIPYDAVERDTNGLSSLSSLDDMGAADYLTFDIKAFCDQVFRVTKNSICIFCSKEQFSQIFNYFSAKPGTTRAIVWEKTNPVPSNGQYVYLSGVEFAVWFKKRGAKVFNAHCKNTVVRYPIFGGKNRIHPAQKHPDLFKELILDNTNEGDIVFDPCAGGMTAAWCASDLKRQFVCCELDKDFYEKGITFLKEKINYDNEH